ncbi:MAG: four helix bundle protein [Oscillospiraceae bacterium]|nr:four helix bundle protein [Oscillospiraceae bacterium]
MKNAALEKSFRFAKRIVALCRFLRQTQKEYAITKQLLRSGTSIGANIAEAKYAQSRPDFISKMNIALKEAGETEYWLRLLRETGYLTQIQFKSIAGDCEELIKILSAIVRSTKNS